MLKKIYILILISLVSCSKAIDDNAVYVPDYHSSTIDVNCKYQMLPLPCESDNSIVTIEEKINSDENETHYYFVKITSNGEKITKEFQINWDFEFITDTEISTEIMDEVKERTRQFSFRLLGLYNHNRFRQTQQGDYLFSMTDTYDDDFCVNNLLCIIKFDKDGNILFAIAHSMVDFTKKQYLSEAITPLYDGGCAVICQAPESDDDDSYYDDDTPKATEFVIKSYDSNGKYKSETALETDKNQPFIRDILNVNDSYFIYIDNELSVYDLDGHMKKTTEINNNNYSNAFIKDGKYILLYGDTSYEKYMVAIFDSDGNILSNINLNENKTGATFVYSATTIDGATMLTGYALNESRWDANLLDYSYYTESRGVALLERNNTFEYHEIKSANAITIFAIIQKPDGTYTIYYDDIDYLTGWLNKISIYNTDNLEPLYYKQEQNGN